MDYYDRKYLEARRKRVIFWKAVTAIVFFGIIGLVLAAISF